MLNIFGDEHQRTLVPSLNHAIVDALWQLHRHLSRVHANTTAFWQPEVKVQCPRMQSSVNRHRTVGHTSTP
jgi:hypothetical protein